MRCVNGHEVSAGANFCPVCGVPVESVQPAELPDAQDETATASVSEAGRGRRRWWLLGLVLILVVAAAAVAGFLLLGPQGGDSEAQGEECRTTLQPFMASLNALHARLSVGLTYADYSSKVGDVAVAHDNLDVSAVSAECLAAALAAEKAFRLYAEGGDLWSRCIRQIGCKTNGPTFGPLLQRKWAAAGDKLDEATTSLETLDGS